MAEINEICQKLDELVKQYFRTLEKLHDEQTCLENSLKQGYFNLSKARYSMGQKAVSSLQYDSKSMRALATVSINENNDNFELIRRNPHTKPSKKSAIVKSVDSTPKETTVRRRRGKEYTDTDDFVPTSRIEELTINGDDNIAEIEDSECLMTDPIRWFGILVPGALRHGQAYFTQAIASCCHIANLQKQVLLIKQEYKTLYCKKQQLNLEKSNIAEKEDISLAGNV